MSTKVSFIITSVEKGKNKNWLVFNSYIEPLDKNKVYTLNFCGTEVEPDYGLKSSIIEGLTNALVNDFGMSPYDIEESKKVLGTGKTYLIKG